MDFCYDFFKRDLTLVADNWKLAINKLKKKIDQLKST